MPSPPDDGKIRRDAMRGPASCRRGLRVIVVSLGWATLVSTVTVAQARLDAGVSKGDEVALRTLFPQADSVELVETRVRHVRAY
ncbi:MAG: hypothetical protein IH939_14210 [Acidobacteria bacterium]|nr:hypothetical protein [Acidobacteriota bacterium]